MLEKSTCFLGPQKVFAGILIQPILEAASWFNEKTFAEIYYKPIVKKFCFPMDILDENYIYLCIQICLYKFTLRLDISHQTIFQLSGNCFVAECVYEIESEIKRTYLVSEV